MKCVVVLVAFSVILAVVQADKKEAKKVYNYVFNVVEKLTKDPSFKEIAKAAAQTDNPIEYLDSKKSEIVAIETRILKETGLSKDQIDVIQKLSDAEAHLKFDEWLPKYRGLNANEKKILFGIPGL
ncbi:unnamed protein product [Bursaphelenchus xylophilus]|uniref:(pine wood nematode) hypothetical protein n=1 Tax=Bursaphelenchus xylophilus TaxID=6326 RepID=A0A1I7SLD7_BURXY|nr:unnamed protein product [Bursaphelenchus xylophilus]CAG9129518.1 unnamed protein product [Bursaphelenchus xylophilus]